MGIAEADIFRVRQAQAAVQRYRILLGLGLGLDPVLYRSLGVLIDQLVRRIEGRRGALRHIGDARAAQPAKLFIRGRA